MVRGLVILLFAVALAIGWTSAGPSAGPDGIAAPMTAGTSSPSPAAAEGGWLTDPAVLERQTDGHFYVRASVNHTTTRFLVDTGASIVALTADDARAAGLSWSNDDLVPIGKGASGTVYGVPVALDSVELGGTMARSISGAIIPQGLPVSLLGQSFLSHVHSVRIEGDRMTLEGQN
ncbi:TIGR02281 family clan AA aspartic protease [Novosphingobium colocasiae]|uniref:retropepsin-like aspartic protease family protein n=1 Tax=Novosphingobium colocasiae TaxID=1256513 RepID=UPI0035B4F63B